MKTKSENLMETYIEMDQIESYKELRDQSLGSYFLGISNSFHAARMYKIIKIDNGSVHVFSTSPGIFHSDNFNWSLQNWDYYKMSSNNSDFLTYINLFIK